MSSIGCNGGVKGKQGVWYQVQWRSKGKRCVVSGVMEE